MRASEELVSNNFHTYSESGCILECAGTAALSDNTDACTGTHESESDFVDLIKSSSLSLYCPSREDSGSVGSSIRALDRNFCDCGTRESGSR